MPIKWKTLFQTHEFQIVFKSLIIRNTGKHSSLCMKCQQNLYCSGKNKSNNNFPRILLPLKNFQSVIHWLICQMYFFPLAYTNPASLPFRQRNDQLEERTHMKKFRTVPSARYAAVIQRSTFLETVITVCYKCTNRRVLFVSKLRILKRTK